MKAGQSQTRRAIAKLHRNQGKRGAADPCLWRNGSRTVCGWSRHSHTNWTGMCAVLKRMEEVLKSKAGTPLQVK